MADGTAGDATGCGRVRALQQEVEGVKTIMTQNVERILARGENLEQLHSKSQDLEATSEHFKTTSQKMARRYWWKNVKLLVILGLEGLVRCQREAEEVTELMKQNFARALERDGRLSDLDSRAQELRAMGETFTRSTRAVARQQRRGHRRWRLVVIGLAGLLLLLLLLILGLALWLPRPPPAIITVTVPPGTSPGGD
uniref:Vesicle associated membrane protein 8 n=1 Tax=Aquila chrysaetos chrysaetos TaxID=223781 RepID=A0A663EBJ2_AQUCH